VVETDPLRRLRLNISYEKLEQMHPADLADIVEELSPAERGAIFETIDSEAAADALSEVDPKMQPASSKPWSRRKPRTSSEEMAPDEAADILSELEKGTSERSWTKWTRPRKPKSRSCSNSRKTPPAA